MVYACAYPLLILLYLISVFVSQPIIHYAVGAVSIVVILLASRRAKGLYFYTGVAFLVVGVALFIQKGLPWYTLLLHFQSMLGMLSLFLVLPFINTLIYVYKFHKTIEHLLKQRITNWDQLYKRCSLAIQFIANFLNIASIPLIVKSLKPSLTGFPSSKMNSFCSKGILRSYALALSWSPLDATVSSSIDLTGAHFLWIAPIMLGLAVVVGGMDAGLSVIRYRSTSFKPSDLVHVAKPEAANRKLVTLVLFIFIFILCVSVVNYLLQQSFLLSVVLVLPVYCVIWAWALRKKGRYFELLAGNWKSHTRGLSNYFFMFLSAGLFVKMVSTTGGVTALQGIYEQYVGIPVLFYLLTAAFFMITSLCGFHPLVSLTIFGAIIHSFMSQLSVIPFTVVLIACSLSTVMYSPFNLSVSLLAKELNINPYRITGWNLAFSAAYILISILFALLLGLFVF
jgi:hypothetical protein